MGDRLALKSAPRHGGDFDWCCAVILEMTVTAVNNVNDNDDGQRQVLGRLRLTLRPGKLGGVRPIPYSTVPKVDVPARASLDELA